MDRHPRPVLLLGTDGNFYGTTLLDGGVRIYGGTVFKISPSGVLNSLYAFLQQHKWLMP